MTTKTRLKTKADIAQYAADLEIELAYLERENQHLRMQLDEAYQLIEQYTEPEDNEPEIINDLCFTIPNPGFVC
jgi:hypothetical protein